MQCKPKKESIIKVLANEKTHWYCTGLCDRIEKYFQLKMSGDMKMVDSLVLLAELIGTVAFAISGAMVALEKKMDIFGVIMLGVCTSVGGGYIRDLTLGITPPAMFSNPIYTIVAAATSIIVFLQVIRNFFNKEKVFYDKILLLMDSLGLGIFVVVGVRTAYTAIPNASTFLLIYIGVLTGVGGGVLRDVLAGNTPYIFKKHFYACAALAGTVLCVALWDVAGSGIAMIAGASTVMILRLCAAHFRWSLPR